MDRSIDSLEKSLILLFLKKKTITE